MKEIRKRLKELEADVAARTEYANRNISVDFAMVLCSGTSKESSKTLSIFNRMLLLIGDLLPVLNRRFGFFLLLLTR